MTDQTTSTVAPDGGEFNEPYQRGLAIFNKYTADSATNGGVNPFGGTVLNSANAKIFHEEWRRMRRKFYDGRLKGKLSLTDEAIFTVAVVESLEKVDGLLLDKSRKAKYVVNDLQSEFVLIKEKLSAIEQSYEKAEDDIDDIPDTCTTAQYLNQLAEEMEKTAEKLEYFEKHITKAANRSYKVTSTSKKKILLGEEPMLEDRLHAKFTKYLEKYNWLEAEYERYEQRLRAEELAREVSRNTDLDRDTGFTGPSTTKSGKAEKLVDVIRKSGEFEIKLQKLTKMRARVPDGVSEFIVGKIEKDLQRFLVLQSSDDDPPYEEFCQSFEKHTDNVEGVCVKQWSRDVYDSFLRDVRTQRQLINDRQLHKLCTVTLEKNQLEEMNQLMDESAKHRDKKTTTTSPTSSSKTAPSTAEEEEDRQRLLQEVGGITTDAESSVADGDESIHSSEGRSEEEYADMSDDDLILLRSDGEISTHHEDSPATTSPLPKKAKFDVDSDLATIPERAISPLCQPEAKNLPAKSTKNDTKSTSEDPLEEAHDLDGEIDRPFCLSDEPPEQNEDQSSKKSPDTLQINGLSKQSPSSDKENRAMVADDPTAREGQKPLSKLDKLFGNQKNFGIFKSSPVRCENKAENNGLILLSSSDEGGSAVESPQPRRRKNVNPQKLQVCSGQSSGTASPRAVSPKPASPKLINRGKLDFPKVNGHSNGVCPQVKAKPKPAVVPEEIIIIIDSD